MTHTENYKIIGDEDKLKEFIDWLPELKDDETFFGQLMFRRKYHFEKTKQDDHTVARFTCNKRNAIYKIKELQIENGLYSGKIVKGIPMESMALYISPNPRNKILALSELCEYVSKFTTKMALGNNNEKIGDIEKKLMSCIQTSEPRQVFIDIDFDNVELDDVIGDILKLVNIEALTAIKTRGGFHLLISPQKIRVEYVKTFYANLHKIKGLDVRNKLAEIPMVGCYQGGFIPHFINLEKYM